MTSTRILLLPAVVLALAIPAQHSDGAAEPEALSLFNGKDLSGWTVFVDPGRGQYQSDAPKDGIFRVEDGMIHVSGARFACLTTEKDYENYHLTVEFKWGTKKWPPRENAVRDSGILMHVTGPIKIWPKSIECQIQEHDCGDFWMVENTELTVNGKRQRGGRVIKSRDAEKPTGEWNTIEVICDGGTIINKVNGVEVNRGTDASLTKGKIVLQSEGAEIWYRKVELRPLKK